MERGVPDPGGEHDQVLPPGRHAHGAEGRGPGQSRRVVRVTRWTESAVPPETIRGHLEQHIYLPFRRTHQGPCARRFYCLGRSSYVSSKTSSQDKASTAAGWSISSWALARA